MPEVIESIHAKIKEHWSQPNKIIKKLNAENAKETTSEGNLPLHTLFMNIGCAFLFKTRHLDIVKKLLELHPEGVKHKNENGQLPVHCAILPLTSSYKTHSLQLIESVKCLLGSYPESLSMKDNDGNLYFCTGKWYRFKFFVKYLIDNHKEWVRMEDGNGRLPLHHAAIYGYSDTIMLCGREFPEATRHKDKEGNLPIHCAESFSDSHGKVLLEALISLDSESVMVKNGAGNLPLHIAARKYHMNTVEYLLKRYPEAANVRNNKGNLPYQCAIDEDIICRLGKYTTSGFDIDQGHHGNNPIVRYLEAGPNFAKCRLIDVKGILQVCYTARTKDAENIKSLDNQLKTAKCKLNDVQDRNTELEQRRKEDAERIQALEDQLKTIATNAESKLSEVQDRKAELERRQKEDVERIQTLENRIKKMDRSNIAPNTEPRNAPENEVPGVQLNKSERNTTTMKALQEARKSELRFLHQVVKGTNDHWTLDQLKETMSSLDSRVTLLREKLKSGEKISNCQKVVALMSMLCEKGVDMNRSDVLDAIDDTNNELLVLERMDNDGDDDSGARTLAAAVSDDNGTVGNVDEARTEEVEYLETSCRRGSPENEPVQKRARVSISP